MTTQDLIAAAGEHSWVVLAWFLAIPAFAFFVGLCHGRERGGNRPWCYVYSVIVYLTCFPGIMAAVLTGYSLFIIRESLLDANLLVYLVPMLSMGVTLGVVKARVNFDDIPGFDRLTGLMTLVALTFVIILAIEKTRIWLVFASSMTGLIGLLIGVFVLLKWSASTLFRRSDEPLVAPPSFPKPEWTRKG